MRLRLSATRAKVASECLRKWWYQEIAQEPRPASYGAEFGSAVHARVEALLKGETPPKVDAERLRELWDQRQQEQVERGVRKRVVSCCSGDIEKAVRVNAELMKAAVMALGEPAWIEYGFELEGGVQGIIDCVAQAPDGAVWLIDFKNYANPKRYGVTSQTMLDDFQVALYADAVFQAFPTAPSAINIAWLKGSNDPNATNRTLERAVQMGVKPENLRPTLNRLFEILATMYFQAGKPEPPEPEWKHNPFTEICSAYGGCPFQTQCKGERVMPILRKNVLKKAAEEATQTPTVELPPPPPKAPQIEQQAGHLYIGCAPASGVPPHVDEVFAAAFIVNGGDARLVEYGQGVPVLVEQLANALQGYRGDLYLPPMAWYRPHVESVLRSWAGETFYPLG